MSPNRYLGKSRMKRLMGDILHKVLVGHRLDHTHDVGRKYIRSERVDRDVPYLIHDVVKSVKILILHDGVQQVPLICQAGITIANPWRQSLSHHPMENSKIGKEVICVRRVEVIVRIIHMGHISSSHHSPSVKLFGIVYASTDPKDLSKLCQLDCKPLSISHPPEDHFFRIKEESGIKLSNAMEVTSLKNHIEGGILLPHVVKVDPLHRNKWLGLFYEHGGIPILMEKGPEPFIGTFFL
jgi:hypothetical protein